jgi:transcription initiation factor IIE alpha subunit
MNLTDLKPSEQLDKVLELLKTFPNKSTEISDIARVKGIKNSLARMILRQLHEDGYAHVNKVYGRKIEIPSFVKVQDEFYTISFKGSLFIEKGGYTKQKEDESFKKSLLNLEKWSLVFFSFIGAFWTFFEIYDRFSKCCSCHH